MLAYSSQVRSPHSHSNTRMATSLSGQKTVLTSFSTLPQNRQCLVELLSISPIFSAQNSSIAISPNETSGHGAKATIDDGDPTYRRPVNRGLLALEKLVPNRLLRDNQPTSTNLPPSLSVFTAPESGSAINWSYLGRNTQLSNSWPKAMLKGTSDDQQTVG